MKKFLFAMLIVFPFALFAQTAAIKIDFTRKVGEIDNVFFK